MVIFASFKDAMAFGYFRKDGMGERIGEMKGDEVQACFFFPVRKAAAVANMDFAVAGLNCAVEARGAVVLLHGRDFTPNRLYNSRIMQ